MRYALTGDAGVTRSHAHVVVITALALLMACSPRSGRPTTTAGGHQGWCVEAHGVVDSSFAVGQARGALEGRSSMTPGLSARAITVTEEGLIISLVVKEPRGTGGGGLVWVDGETGCAIILKRYE